MLTDKILNFLFKKSTLSILWKDAHTRGVNGVVELQVSDLPRHGALVKDLFPVLNSKINSNFQGDRSFREVETFLLYGTRVSPDRCLDSLIPELGLVPRFVAVMRVYPKKMSETQIVITVKTLTDSNLRLRCWTSDTVGEVKLQIQEKKMKITRGFQRLVYDGKQLEDHLALSTYGITNRSQIHLVRMMNGGGTSRIFADVSDLSLLQELEFSPRAPEWRCVTKGLNIEGKCKNPRCDAFQQPIIFPRGFQEFNLIRDDDTKCPMCQSKVTPRTCGFYDCAWKFDGLRADDDFSVISSWKDARGEKCHLFDADKAHGSPSAIFVETTYVPKYLWDLLPLGPVTLVI